MHRPPPSSRAFTLIEMIVVISIIISLMALGIPALINSQTQADDFATPNVLFGVHTTCQRNARQFGSAGLVYGFTLNYAFNTPISGQWAADNITPWVLVGNAASPLYQTSPGGGNLMADFGKTPLWNGNNMSFWDRYRPCANLVINDTTVVNNPSLLVVAYEPRSGFPHVFSAAPNWSTLLNSITDPAGASTLPDKVKIQIWTTRGMTQSSVIIHKSGVCNAHNGP